MVKFRWALIASVMMLLVGLSLVPAGIAAAKTVYVGGTMSLTGPYAEDSAAILAAFEDYIKYVNETKQSGPLAQGKMAGRCQHRAALAG